MFSKQNLPRLLMGIALIPVLLLTGYWSGLFEKAPPSPPIAVAAAEEPEPVNERRIRLKTVYLLPPLGEYHRIYLTGQLGGAGRVALDDRTRSLDQFGDTAERGPGIGSFTPVRIKKNASQPGQDRELYDIETDGHSDFRLRLVAPNNPAGTYRLLVLDPKEDKILRVLILEAWIGGGGGAAAV